SPTPNSIAFSAFNVVAGATSSTTSGSTTWTVLVSVAVLPAASETVYTTSYVPASSVFTSPEISMASVTSPSTSSSAVAPGSSYVSPTSNSIGFSPFRVISGATSSTTSGSTTWTVLVSVAVLPAASETVYTTSYVPASSVFTSPEISMPSVTSPSTSSSAVAPGSSYVSPTSNSIGFSPFRVISGATS